MFDHSTYLSPFTWRYGSEAMRRLFSERHRRRLWRRVWIALARAQAAVGLVTAAQLADLEAHADDVDLDQALAREAVTRHDVMAEIQTFAAQCPVGGRILHLGATSMDVVDNAEVLRQRQALDLILTQLADLIRLLADRCEHYAETPVMGYTHLQPAEPTTLGYRLAQTLQDLLLDWEELVRLRRRLKGKGLKGAVGNLAAFGQLLAGTTMTAAELERLALADLGLEAYPVTTQTYPRKQDWFVLNALAGLGGTLYRFAFDLRLLQSPAWGELSEPFAAGQVGSSAMPFKRNPVTAEKVDSLARYLAALPQVAWHNAAHSLLERTLDDSANRRSLIPEAFLIADELLLAARHLVAGLTVWPTAMARNLATYGVFAAGERLLMEAVKAGGDRQHLHEVMRRHSLAAWAAVQEGQANPLVALLTAEPEFTRLLPVERIRELLDASAYVGEAPTRTRALVAQARSVIATGWADPSSEPPLPNPEPRPPFANGS